MARFWYRRHGGRVLETAAALLREAQTDFPGLLLCATGTAGVHAARRLGLPHVNELLALAAAVRRWHPEVSTILEMGGEDSKMLLLDGDAVADFAINAACAAGTGSFLDQQAERMRLDIEEFAEAALRATAVPAIAGRCSVFAKSDMIHLQQIGSPVEDIVAGLCMAVARNFKGSIVRNRRLLPRVAFLGGVALNRGMIRAFAGIFGLEDLLVPEQPAILGAAGAGLKAMAGAGARAVDPALLAEAEAGEGLFTDSGLMPLVREGDGFALRHLAGPSPDPAQDAPQASAAPESAYLGIDVGSISTNLAVVDEERDGCWPSAICTRKAVPSTRSGAAFWRLKTNWPAVRTSGAPGSPAPAGT